jgi:hypothetical protein
MPGGSLTEIGKNGDLKSENEVAAVLARSGYEIVRNPPRKPNGKKPDYFMEGDYWIATPSAPTIQGECASRSERRSTRSAGRCRRAGSSSTSTPRGPVREPR